MSWDEPDMPIPQKEWHDAQLGFALDDRRVVLLQHSDEKGWRPITHWPRRAVEMLPAFFSRHSGVDAAGSYLEIEG